MFCFVFLPFPTFLEALSAQPMISSSAVLWLLSVLGSHTQWSQGLPGRLQKVWKRREWDACWHPERAEEGESIGQWEQRQRLSKPSFGHQVLELQIRRILVAVYAAISLCLIQNAVHCRGRFMECSQLHACGFIPQLLILKTWLTFTTSGYSSSGEKSQGILLFNCPYIFKIANIPTVFPKYSYLFWMWPILPVRNLHSLFLSLLAVCVWLYQLVPFSVCAEKGTNGC